MAGNRKGPLLDPLATGAGCLDPDEPTETTGSEAEPTGESDPNGMSPRMADEPDWSPSVRTRRAPLCLGSGTLGPAGRYARVRAGPARRAGCSRGFARGRARPVALGSANPALRDRQAREGRQTGRGERQLASGRNWPARTARSLKASLHDHSIDLAAQRPRATLPPHS